MAASEKQIGRKGDNRGEKTGGDASRASDFLLHSRPDISFFVRRGWGPFLKIPVTLQARLEKH